MTRPRSTRHTRTHTPVWRLVTAAGLTAAAIGATSSGTASAATIVVDSTADVVDAGDGVTTLREAVIEANGLGGADVIVFDPTVFDPAGSATITLTGTLDVTDELTVTGPGSSALTLEVGGADGVIRVAGAPAPLTVTDLSIDGAVGPGINVVDSAAPVTIRRTVVTGGLDQGITLMNVGAVTISDVMVTGSLVDNMYIDVSGDMSITDSRFDGSVTADGIEIISGGALTLTDVAAGDNADDGIEIDGIDASTPDPVGPIVGTRVTTERNGENGIDIEIATDVTLSAVVSNDNGPTDSDFGIGLGVFDATGSVTVTESEFRRNAGLDGGGVLVFDVGGDVTLTDLDITDNDAEFEGGGLIVDTVGGTTALTRLSILGNRATDPDEAFAAGALILLDDTALSIVDSTIAGNVSAVDGGGLLVFGYGATGPVVTIERTTISDNTAAEFDGGIAVFGASTTIVNSTITGNVAADGAAAVGVAGGDATIRHTTIAGNTATDVAGIIAVAESTVTLDHTIVSGNTGSGYEDLGVDPPVTTSDHGFLATDVAAVFTGTGNVTGDDPGLDPLGDNGGLTETMRPSPTSGVIGAGDPAVAVAPATDQRDGTRIVGTIDIGAVEVDPGRLDVSPLATTVAEADGSVTITVTRSGTGDGPVTAELGATDGTAVAGEDYVGFGPTLSWADGEVGARDVVVTILADDEVEDDETFTATLAGVTGGAAVGDSVSTVTISDSTTPPSNSPPVIGPVADRTLVVGGVDVVTVAVTDPEGDPVALTATPTDPSVIGPVTVTEITGGPTTVTAPMSVDRTFRLEYRSTGVVGQSAIDLVASDGSATDTESFTVTVEGAILPATGADGDTNRRAATIAFVLVLAGAAMLSVGRRRHV